MIAYLVGDDAMAAYETRSCAKSSRRPGIDLRAPRVAHRRRRARTTPSASPSSAPGCPGIVAAHRLRQAGVDVTVFEKNTDVGGTWFENTYPGLPRRRPEPPLQLLVRADDRVARVLLRPAEPARLLPLVSPTNSTCARTIRFDTEVESCDVRRATAACGRCVVEGDGRDPRVRRASCSAVGQLNRPKVAGHRRASSDSRASTSTRPSGTTTSTSTASASASSARARAPRSSSRSSPSEAGRPRRSSSGRRRGSSPSPNYHDQLPDGLRWSDRACCRTTSGGTACGCSGARTKACCRAAPRSIRTGTPTRASRSAR